MRRNETSSTSRRDIGTSFIAKIQPQELQRAILPIHFAKEVVELPVWHTPEGYTFIATADIRQHLRVDFSIGQLSEWVAMGEVPASMINIVWTQSERNSVFCWCR